MVFEYLAEAAVTDLLRGLDRICGEIIVKSPTIMIMAR